MNRLPIKNYLLIFVLFSNIQMKVDFGVLRKFPNDSPNSWHRTFSPSLRYSAISTFVEDIVPECDRSTLSENSEVQLFMLASASEIIAYETATSTEEYYQILAKVIGEIKWPISFQVQGAKDWHSSITPDIRHHVVRKIMKAIVPTSDPAALRDDRLQGLFPYAKKVESDLYEMADSTCEYYQLMAEKICKIETEMEEKRRKRKSTQLNQQQQSRQNYYQIMPMSPETRGASDGDETNDPMQNQLTTSQQNPPQQQQQAEQSQNPSQSSCTSPVNLPINSLYKEMQITKDWHNSITPDLRNYIVHKLVRTILPTVDPAAMLDEWMHNLVAYAKKIEDHLYKMTNSKSEYYDLIGEKIYDLLKVLQEKHEQRKEQLERINVV